MDSDSRPSEADGSPLSDPPTDSEPEGSSGSGSEASTPSVEWLATTRQRRATAGNRMKSLLANEEPDDSDLELLFAEDDNDEAFSDLGHDSRPGTDAPPSSDDDDDDAIMADDGDEEDDDDDESAASGNDLAGERALEEADRQRRAAQRKRKARDAVPAKFRKRVRIEPAASTAQPAPAPPRPKKKSERASWLPSPAELPTRASARHTTRLSKEQLHQQMVEREAKRLRQLALMQKKAARLEALKKAPLTQAERLAEAAVVELRNSKSLSRWEEAEKAREQQRRDRLAALENRTLRGPVITFWSGVGAWAGPAAARPVALVEDKPRRKREKADKSAAAAKPAPDDRAKPMPPATTTATTTTATATTPTTTTTTAATTTTTTTTAPDAPPTTNNPASSSPPPARPSSVLAAPVLAPPAGLGPGPGPSPDDAPKSSVLAPPQTSPPTAPLPVEPTQAAEEAVEPAAPPQPAARNLILYKNFDPDALADRSILTQILLGRKMRRLPKSASAPACVITGHAAFYRDPKTGLPYHDVAAYREIQRLRGGHYRWSRLLGAWVGSGARPARGVPDRFCRPDNAEPDRSPPTAAQETAGSKEVATEPAAAPDKAGPKVVSSLEPPAAPDKAGPKVVASEPSAAPGKAGQKAGASLEPAAAPDKGGQEAIAPDPVAAPKA